MTPRAAENRRQALELIQQAQSLLYQACEKISPLKGWGELWDRVGDHAQATKSLWHEVNEYPYPTGHDHE